MYTVWNFLEKRYVTLNDFDKILPKSIVLYNTVAAAEDDIIKYKVDKTHLKIYKVRLL